MCGIYYFYFVNEGIDEKPKCDNVFSQRFKLQIQFFSYPFKFPRTRKINCLKPYIVEIFLIICTRGEGGGEYEEIKRKFSNCDFKFS